MQGRSVYLPKNANSIHLLKLIPQGRAKNMKPVNISLSGNDCANCNHIVLQANEKIVQAPCKKEYELKK